LADEKIISGELLGGALKEFNIEINDHMLESFDSYAKFLIEYNEKVNVTAITEPDEIAIKHFADSASILGIIEVRQGASIIDVGCGAGFPSVPIKIVRPDLKLMLLDSLNKRIVFLNELCALLKIEAQAVHARAEEAGRNVKFREKYDVATARAVANLAELAEYCLPFVKVGGVFLAMKGPDPDAEVKEAQKAIELLGGKIEDVVKYSLPDGSGRSLVIIKKISQTSTKYPRQSAKIAKSPIR